MRRMTMAMVAAAAVLLGACGGGGSPKSTVQDYLRALGDGDGGKVCDLLTTKAKKAFESEIKQQKIGSGCKDLTKLIKRANAGKRFAQLKKVADDGKIKVNTQGDKATATVSYKGKKSRPLALAKEDGDWKIAEGIS